MLIRTLLSTTIIAGSVTAALYSRAPAGVAPQVRPDIQSSAASIPETQMVDYTFVFTEGEADQSAANMPETRVVDYTFVFTEGEAGLSMRPPMH